MVDKNFNELSDEKLSILADEMARLQNDEGLKKILAQISGKTGKDIFGTNFVMDESEFEKIQKQYPWTMQSSVSLANKQRNGKGTQLDFWENLSLISCFIFGALGIEKDLNKAEEIINYSIPLNVPDEQAVFINAHMNILRGTIFAYRKDYIKASYFYISGLKLGTNLSNPYCDFIRYIIGKITSLPKEEARYYGVGYTKNKPMGSICQGEYDKWAAIQIIPCLKGDNDEVIVAHQGSNGLYGYLQHCCDDNGINIYETFLIDKNFKLKTIKFYFNAYFSPTKPKPIKIPNGFHINKNYAPNLQGKIIGSNGLFVVER